MNLSEIIHAYRADRPDEWTLDEWVKKATVLEKRIAELENQWISVEDRLPDELQSVLSFSSYEGVLQSIYRAGNFKKTLVVWEHLNVTHWMPLPQPNEALKEQYDE